VSWALVKVNLALKSYLSWHVTIIIGALFASLIPGLVRDGQYTDFKELFSDIKFVMLFSGFLAREERLARLFSEPVITSSLHCFGVTDEFVQPGKGYLISLTYEQVMNI
jgi:predicted branched-subunit amino acid permease